MNEVCIAEYLYLAADCIPFLYLVIFYFYKFQINDSLIYKFIF